MCAPLGDRFGETPVWTPSAGSAASMTRSPRSMPQPCRTAAQAEVALAGDAELAVIAD
jgi:hypothetical protein